MCALLVTVGTAPRTAPPCYADAVHAQHTSGPAGPVEAFHTQDAFFSTAFSVLEEAISQRAFPAASVAVTSRGKLIALKSFGHFVFEEDLAGTSPKSVDMRQDRDFDAISS